MGQPASADQSSPQSDLSGKSAVEQVSVVGLLIAARKLIEYESDWCQGRYYDGEKCCSDGALVKVANSYPAHARGVIFADQTGEYDRALELLNAAAGGDIWDFNDSHTHAEVLAVFDRAIEASEKLS